MANVAPATIFPDLLGQAVAALRKRPTAFELRRLERDAQTLAKVNASQAFEIRAHVAAAEDRFDEADALYERAFALSDQMISSIVRYLIALSGSGQGNKVKSMFLKYRDLVRTDPNAVRAVKRVLGGNGWWESAIALDADLQKMGLPTDGEEDQFCTVDTEKVPEEQVAEAVIFVRNFLRSKNANLASVHSLAVPLETGDSALLFEFFLDSSEDETAELEWDLFAELAEKQFPAETSKNVVLALAPTVNPDVHL